MSRRKDHLSMLRNALIRCIERRGQKGPVNEPGLFVVVAPGFIGLTMATNATEPPPGTTRRAFGFNNKNLPVELDLPAESIVRHCRVPHSIWDALAPRDSTAKTPPAPGEK